MQGSRLANEMGIVTDVRVGAKPTAQVKRRTRVLILGVNGFIGNHLTERLLKTVITISMVWISVLPQLNVLLVTHVSTLLKVTLASIQNGLNITSKM